MNIILTLLSTYLMITGAYIISNDIIRRSRYKRTLLKSTDFVNDDGEVPWEEISESQTGTIRIPSKYFSDANCQEINDTNIDLTVCSITEDKIISFNIDGVVDTSFLKDTFPYSDKIANNFEVILEDNIELAISIMIITAIMNNIPDNKNINRVTKKIINSVILGITVILKNAKSVL